MEINYSFVRTTSNIDDTPIQEILTLYDSKIETDKKFGLQSAASQDGEAIAIDCRCDMSFMMRVGVEPRLAEFKFGAGDRPSYLSAGCENTSHADARVIVNTTGDSGVAWAAPVEELV